MVGPPGREAEPPARVLESRSAELSAFVRVASLPAASIALTLSSPGSRFSLRSFLRSAALGRIVTVTVCLAETLIAPLFLSSAPCRARPRLSVLVKRPGSVTSSRAASLTRMPEPQPAVAQRPQALAAVGQQRDRAARSMSLAAATGVGAAPAACVAGCGGAGAGVAEDVQAEVAVGRAISRSPAAR